LNFLLKKTVRLTTAETFIEINPVVQLGIPMTLNYDFKLYLLNTSNAFGVGPGIEEPVNLTIPGAPIITDKKIYYDARPSHVTITWDPATASNGVDAYWY
jgi:hypothetical protein